MSPFEPCDDYLDWEIGVHGVYLCMKNPALGEYDERASTHRSQEKEELTVTFLPEVALSQGWSKQETIDKAIRKAGWNGKITEQMRKSLRVYRYSSHKATVTWDEFDTWRRLENDPITREISIPRVST